MKNTITSPLTISLAVLGASLLGPTAQADQIAGSIGFGSLGVTIVGSSLATATSFSLIDPFITTETGIYSAAPILTPITFSGFQFNSPVASVAPLWTFSVGTTTYTFDATTVQSHYDSDLRQWDIGGNGMAIVSGFTPTPGTWNVNLSQSGTSIVFDSSSAAVPAASAPDDASTMFLLGGGFVGLTSLGRKLKR